MYLPVIEYITIANLVMTCTLTTRDFVKYVVRLFTKEKHTPVIRRTVEEIRDILLERERQHET